MNAWQARAAELAAWTMARLVNRTDCRGGYRRPEEVGREYTRLDGTRGKLGSQTTRKDPLTLGILARHYAAVVRQDVVGTHSTSTANTSCWGALDIDVHEGSSVSPSVTLAASLAWYESLRRGGFRPLLTSSNGRGGYHLRFLLATPAPTADVFYFLKRLASDFRRHGLTAAPECFPKQPRVEPGRYGNWLRLPGRHHTREHWPEVWDGNGWLADAAAVAYLLSLDGDPAELIPPAPPAPARPPASCPPPWLMRATPSDGWLSRRIRGRIARLPHLSAGQGRDRIAFNFSAWLRRNLNLTAEQALPWLVLWDQGNSPPLGEEALLEISDNGYRYGKDPIGCGLLDQARFAGRQRHGIIRVTVEV